MILLSWRQVGVVGKFVEFYGPGVEKLSIADRATIANMCPEYGKFKEHLNIANMCTEYGKFKEQLITANMCQEYSKFKWTFNHRQHVHRLR